MELYIDTANIEEIKEIASWGVLSGVTTNPSLAAKEGRSFEDVLTEITSLVNGPVSAEVIGLKADEIVKEGLDLASRSNNVVVKIPMIPDGLTATKELSDQGVRVNMTLIFSTNQAILAASAGASYVSPFVGRLDDIDQDGMKVVKEIADIYEAYEIDTEIIAASIRHPMHVTQAALAGADIATIPYKVFKLMAQHPLTDKGIASFLKDWENLQKGL